MKGFVILLLALSLSTQLRAQIPRQISYQGVLTDSLGMAKPDGSYGFVFQLYGTATAGTSFWKEEKSLVIKKGLFATMLGDHVPLPDSLKFDRPYWLSVEVAGEVLSPRLPFAAVAYSLSSAQALRADSALYTVRAAHSDTASYAASSGSMTSGGDLSVGSSTKSGLLSENFNGIEATNSTTAINLIPGLVLVNNTSGVTQNSPSIQLKHFSWNSAAGGSQENSWYIQNWGFTTEGIAGGVFSLINKHQQQDGTFRTSASFAIDEVGRTLIGHGLRRGDNYFGFWGDDFGQWGVILSGKTVVGWPENSIVSDFRVTGKTTLDGTLTTGPVQVNGSLTAANLTTYTSVVIGSLNASTLAADAVQVNGPLTATTLQTAAGQRFKVLSGSDSLSVSMLQASEGFTSATKSFGYTFTNVPAVTITNTSSTGAGMDKLSLGVTEKTSNGFAVRVNNLLATPRGNGIVRFDWIAIGE